MLGPGIGMDPERVTVHCIAWLGQGGLGGVWRWVRRDKVKLGIGAQERVSVMQTMLQN